MDLTHINDQGNAKMIDVSDKKATIREAVACASIYLDAKTIDRIINKDIKKGDVLGVAQVAGIMGAKATSNIIPMCHPISITGCDITFNFEINKINIIATAKTIGQTGVEMEALSAVTISALTIYDMCKSIDKKMSISDISLIKKSGGKSDYNSL